jgi:hypothetical protein
LRADAVRDALLSQGYPSPKQALQRLQQITEDEVLRTELTRCARSDFRCAGEPLLERLEHADVLLSVAIGLPDAAVCRRFLISPEKAMKIRANLQVRYPALFERLDRFRRESVARGYAEHDGRRIYLEGLRSSNIEKRTRPQRLPSDGLCAIESSYATKYRPRSTYRSFLARKLHNLSPGIFRPPTTFT